VTELDIHIFRLVYGHLSGDWLVPMAVLSAIGGGWGALLVVPLFVSMRTRRFAGSLAAVLAITALLVFVLKRIVARARPCVRLADVKALVFGAPSDFSFPSGHSAGSFAFAVFVAVVLVKRTPENATAREALLRRLGAATLVLAAAGVGISRIVLGVHFPGDVLAGAALGTAIGSLGARVHLASA